MAISYILFSPLILTCLFTKNRTFLWGCLSILLLGGWTQGLIQGGGLIWLFLFLGTCHLFFKKKNLTPLARLIIGTLLFSILIGLVQHLLPGFSHTLVLDKVSVSPLSRPYSMYLNFDKVMAGLILYVTSDSIVSERSIDKTSIKQTLIVLLSCVTFILIPSFLSGHVRFDFKIPGILGIWVLHNVLFVCMAEEVIFRGFLQKLLLSFLKNVPGMNYGSLLISSLFFGLHHFKGGMIYVLLASICSLFYGYVYEKTKNIKCSMLVHFGLNLVHFIFFTYPSAQR